MKLSIILYLIIQFCKDLQANPIKEEYSVSRIAFLREEEKLGIGGHLILTEDEDRANYQLMKIKEKELAESFKDPAYFPPARNFLEARSDIEKSEVFKILKKMPKGAVLHVHNKASVSKDFVYDTLTFLDHLYVCDESSKLIAKFFNKPPNDCEWKLLSDLRATNESTASDINKRIRQELSMASDNPDVDYPTVDAAWKKFNTIFDFISPILTYRPAHDAHLYQCLKELYDDNILYVEIRSPLSNLYELNGTKYNSHEVVGIYKNVTDKFMKDHPDFVGVKIIHAWYRGVTPEEVVENITKATNITRSFPELVAGIDLVGQEDKGNTLESHIAELQTIGKDVGAFYHAGETKWYGTSTDENLIDAVLLNSKRIGHGYAASKHPKVMELIKEKKIAIEVCPISNQVLGLVKDLRNHPASIFFAENYPVVISNDDPGLWGAKGLSYDFYEAFMGMMSRHANIRALKALALNSITYSAMSKYQKNKAMEIWQRKWIEFIAYLKGYCHGKAQSSTIKEV